MAADAAELLTPALLIRVDRVRRNIETMLGELDGSPERWRPHVKTSKIPQVFDLLLDAGIRQFKCATTREAAVLLGRMRRLFSRVTSWRRKNSWTTFGGGR